MAYFVPRDSTSENLPPLKDRPGYVLSVQPVLRQYCVLGNAMYSMLNDVTMSRWGYETFKKNLCGVRLYINFIKAK